MVKKNCARVKYRLSIRAKLSYYSTIVGITQYNGLCVVFCPPPAGLPLSPLYHQDNPSKHCRRRKARTVFSDQQLTGLEKRFESQRYLSTPERMELASQLSLSETQVRAVLILSRVGKQGRKREREKRRKRVRERKKKREEREGEDREREIVTEKRRKRDR